MFVTHRIHSNSDESKRTKSSQKAYGLEQYSIATCAATNTQDFKNKYNRNVKMSDGTVLKSYEGMKYRPKIIFSEYTHEEVKESDHYNSMYRI
ncbi:unnamed protein product [Rhizophagus irregularis]|nr:unnamed protein product [Rhizophagus irregularis]